MQKWSCQFAWQYLKENNSETFFFGITLQKKIKFKLFHTNLNIWNHITESQNSLSDFIPKYSICKTLKTDVENFDIECTQCTSLSPRTMQWKKLNCLHKDFITTRLSNNGVITFWKVRLSLPFLTFAYNILYCDILNIIPVHWRGVFLWTFLRTGKKIKVKLCKWTKRALPFEGC